jgi:hypothetical protein
LNVVKVAESLLAATPAVLQHTRIEPGLLARVRVFVERFCTTISSCRCARVARAPRRSTSR